MQNNQERDRLLGALLVARTVRHLFTPPLTLALGYAQLIAEDASLPPPLRSNAEEVIRAVAEIDGVLERLRRLRRIVEVDAGLPDGPVIDLGRSSFFEERLP